VAAIGSRFGWAAGVEYAKTKRPGIWKRFQMPTKNVRLD
jgi:hypothetical protein